MLDQTNANIERHIKTHTERSDDDRSAVSVLETFLRSNGRINTSFASDDKWPNHDNTFEFVPNPDISRRPKQTFYVQIKGTRNYTKREGVIKYTLKDLAFPAFICDRVSLDPGILFVILNPAERGNERVFWKYMSPNFLNSIDFAKGSMTVSFSPEEEILNDDESVLAFCERLEEIVERHSCVNQLERHSYSFEEAKRIVEACDEEITESIDNLSILNKNRDNISRRILTRLNDLCISALLLNAMKDGYQSPNAGFAWEYSLLRANTKYLGNFYRGLQYIGRRIPEEGQAERLMLKYYSFMWQIRQSLYENYGITVLQNLEKFQEYTGTDEQDKQYYELVANAFSTPKTEQKHNSNTRFYIQKRTPFYVGKERYFEVTLQQADIYASKYNRITAYTKLDISTGYSVQIDYVPSYINLWGVNTEIKIITAWRVSVDPKCLNKLGRILNMRLQLSSKYGEYDALMRFLTETGMDFLEMIDLREIHFSNLLESVYKKTNTSYFKDVLQQLRDNYSTGSTRFGRYTIRYLLLNLREDLLERVMPSQFSPQWKCKDLYLSRKCFPFECNPLASDLADSKTSQISQAKYLARVVEKEKTEVAVPYWSIVKSMQDTGEIYCDHANTGTAVVWRDWKYKVGDHILFNDTDRFSLLYNNLKGRIVQIELFDSRIRFTVDVEIPLTEQDCQNDGIEFIDIIDDVTRIRFDVLDFEEEMADEDRKKAIVPFQLAYAVSIHKAQGLEYRSVKVVIPSSNAEKITHGIFYTAITRAKEKLKIYWSSETMQEVVAGFSVDTSKQKSLAIIKEKLKQDKNT